MSKDKENGEKAREKIADRPLAGAEAPDLFIANTTFPEAAAVFAPAPKTLEASKDAACIVLDTNALLVPYSIGPQTLAEVEATYRRLVREARLVVPAQVAREFARNRVTKLSELHQRLSRRRSQVQPFQQGTYPLLEAFEEYQRLRKVEADMDALLSEYRTLLAAVIDRVSSWEWNDPVSLLYGTLFPQEIVVDTTASLEDIRTLHLKRFTNKIPPGYKDEAKDDRGIGDLLIWLTILHIGSTRHTSVIFVSGEEKADWWHRSEGQQLYPRFELVDEFRRASGGHSFHIIKFSRLLELFGASTEVVAEVRQEERSLKSTVPLSRHSTTRLRHIQVEKIVAMWLVEAGYKVQTPSSDLGYDYLVTGSGDEFAVEVFYARGRSEVRARLRHLAHRARTDPSRSLPLTVVVAAERSELLDEAEQSWTDLDPPFRLSTGLVSDGIFQVRRPL